MFIEMKSEHINLNLVETFSKATKYKNRTSEEITDYVIKVRFSSGEEEKYYFNSEEERDDEFNKIELGTTNV